MKPISIEFQAFGSYPGHERVEFGPLYERGLFVVSGETGTGKSTLFDAITFALYGAMPLKELRDIRSHHAADNVPTFVRFTFELDGVRHLVERELGPKSAKQLAATAVWEVKKASLARLDGGASVPLAAKTSDVTAMCTAMVGLSADQFQRVVLLPQGDVAKFLLAGSADREPLLGALFGGEVFDRVGEVLKAEEADLTRRLGAAQGDAQRDLEAAREQVRRLVTSLGAPGAALVKALFAPDTGAGAEADAGTEAGVDAEAEVGAGDGGGDAEVAAALDAADRDALAGILDTAEQVDGPLDRLAAARTDAQAAERLATAELARVHDAAGRFTRLAQAQSALADAERDQPDVDAAATAAERSRHARPVVEADDERQRTAAAKADADAQRDDMLAAIDAAAVGLGVELEVRTPAAIATAVQQRRAVLEDQRIRLHALAVADTAVAAAVGDVDAAVRDAGRAMADRDEVSARLVAVRAERPGVAATAGEHDELRRQAEALAVAVGARTELDGAESRLAQLLHDERKAADHHGETLRRYINTTAPRLAADLRPDEPCPVCGALEHPAPATADDGDAVPYEAVERAGTAFTEVSRARGELADECARLRGALGADAARPAAELAQQLETLRERVRTAEAAVRRLGEIDVEIERLESTERDLLVAVAEAQAAEGAARNALAAATAALEEARDAASGLDTATVEADGGEVERLEHLVDGLDEVFAAAAGAEVAAGLAAEHARRILEAGPFGDVVAARAALLDLGEEQARIDAAATLRSEIERLTTTIATLAAEGVPDSAPDVDAADQAVRRVAAERLALDEAVHAAGLAAGDARAALDRYDRTLADTAELRSRHLTVSRAKKVCVEGGAPRIPLRRWVLARELDRVTAAANVHLSRMSNARYALHRRLDIVDARKSFGLDLEVRDAHTGRSRAPSSLSGGEQFQASLALALGLADVVSHGGSASGRRFEALFVDEGFGSLDPEALQMAIDALHHLHAGGRMVGAITHVEAMKQDLHIGIEVRRLPDGRGSTLVVHP